MHCSAWRERRGCNRCLPCAGSLSFGLGRHSPAVDSVGRLDDDSAVTSSAVLTPAPEGGYVALNPETGCTTQGETVDEALANLREATGLFLEEFPLSPEKPGAKVIGWDRACS